MVWPWEEGQAFPFFVEKQPGKQPDTIDARYYVFDRRRKHWALSATLTSPQGGKRSVATFGGGLNSFLENFAGRDKEAPKLALYRVWLGRRVDRMKHLTRARGDGTWGKLHDAYFLAEGDASKLAGVFAGLGKTLGKPQFGGPGKQVAPISDQPVPAAVIEAFKNPPGAVRVGP